MSDLLRAARMAWDRHEYGSVWKFANQALNDEPDKVEALFFLGAASREVGNIGLALTVFRRALALEPAKLELWRYYASTLHDLNRYDEARECYQTILKLLPKDAGAMANMSGGYVQEGEPRKAVEWADKALAINPDSHIAHISRAFGNLGLGRWRDGWRDAEWLYGHHMLVRVYNPKENEEPAWDGAPGQTVVVMMDQGIGDHIMFAGCMAQLIADCKQVIIDCEGRMAGFWRRNFPQAIVYPTIGHPRLEWPKDHQIDAHIHVSWLGRYYRNTNADFPRKPYLTADPVRMAAWRERMAEWPKPWVGIAWQGGLQRSLKHLRSLKVGELEPIMGFAGTLVDMSYHDSAREVAQWNMEHPQQIRKPPIDGRDYEDTVALAAVLDDIVTCTTTLAHVCGAIGRHAYVLVPQAPQWRYQHLAEDGGLYWYPPNSIDMVRQVKGETSWGPAVNRLADKMGRIAQLRAA